MSDVVLHPQTQAPPTDVPFVRAIPRVDLLPEEVRERSKVKSTRRLVFLGLVGALAIVAVGYLAATSQVLTATFALENANARTADLQAQIAGFGEVRELEREVEVATAIERVGTATAIDWPTVIGTVLEGAPGDVIVTNVQSSSQSPIENFSQPTAPLQAPRIGQVVVTIRTADFAAIADWVERVQANPTFSDAFATSVSVPEGIFEVSLTAHLSPELTAIEEDAP